MGRAPGRVFSLKGDINIEKIKQSKYFQANLQQYNESSASELVWNTEEFFLFHISVAKSINRGLIYNFSFPHTMLLKFILNELCMSFFLLSRSFIFCSHRLQKIDLPTEQGELTGDLKLSQGGRLDGQGKLICKASKVMTQAKLESLYGNNIRKTNNGSSKSGLNSKNIDSGDCMIVEKSSSYSSLPKGNSVSNFFKVEDEERGHRNTLGMKRAHVEISSPTNSNSKSPSGTEKVHDDVSGNGFVTAKAKLVII